MSTQPTDDLLGIAAHPETVRGSQDNDDRRTRTMPDPGNGAVHIDPANPRQQVSLRHEGDVWTLEANGRKVTLLHSKGMSYLEMLMRSPHRPVHTLELSGIGEE